MAPVATLFKDSMYRRPNPLFIWNEGSSHSMVWTAASLYWALAQLDSEPRVLEPWNILTHETFPRVFWEHAQSAARAPHAKSIYVFGTTQEWAKRIQLIPSLVLSGHVQEIHFKEDL